jgi:uncharacterized metal-binding protein YceD (DUF177 family)
LIQISSLSETKAWIKEGELEADLLPRLADIFVKANLPLNYQIRLSRSKEEITCSGKLEGILMIPCDRCGQDLQFDVKEKFAFKIVPETNLVPHNGKEVLLEDVDLDVDFYRDGQIDWQRILEDQAILSLPIRSFCEDQGRSACAIPLDPEETENLWKDNPFASLSNQVGKEIDRPLK